MVTYIAVFIFFFFTHNILIGNCTDMKFLYSVSNMVAPTYLHTFLWVFIEIVSMTSVNGCCRGVSLLGHEQKTAVLSLRP